MLSEDKANELCAAFQDVAFAHVEDRLSRALGVLDRMGENNITAVVVVGGVAANKELRRYVYVL